MSEEISEMEVVYLKCLRFADNNSVDYKLNGRPYLVYKLDKKYAYLLKISSSHIKEDYYYCNIILDKKKSKKESKESYVDLRYIYVIEKEELEKKKYVAYTEFKKSHLPKKNHHITLEDYNRIERQIDLLNKIEELKSSFLKESKVA